MNTHTKKLTLSAMFLAIGIILPFFTGQVPQIGNMLLPIHFPVFLCGMICGAPYGLAIGFVLPIFRSFLFGMPMMYPMAIAMAFELAVYGVVAGWIYGRAERKNTLVVYQALLLAMVCGRVVWGMVEILLLGIGGNGFTWQMFLAGALVNAILGILLQLVLIPAIMAVVVHKKVVPENAK